MYGVPGAVVGRQIERTMYSWNQVTFSNGMT
jgi:hypothetical protein